MEDRLLTPFSGIKLGKRTAKIKSEYLITDQERISALERSVSDGKKEVLQEYDVKKEKDEEPMQPHKRRKINNVQMIKLMKVQNKAQRQPYKCERGTTLCNSLVDVVEGEPVPSCQLKMCPSIHDVDKYLELKSADIGSTCYVYSLRGRCPKGVSCRFGSEHLTKNGKNLVNPDIWEKFQNDNTPSALYKDLQYSLRKRLYDFSKSDKILERFTKSASERQREKELAAKQNVSAVAQKMEEEEDSKMSVESVDIDEDKGESGDMEIPKPGASVSDEELTKIKPEEELKVEDTKISVESGDIDKDKGESGEVEVPKPGASVSDEELIKIRSEEKKVEDTKINIESVDIDKDKGENGGISKPGACVSDEELIKIRPEEKKGIAWRDKLYLSPLTTVGNLPFRRVCKEFGVDVTCAEMVMANPLLQGTFQEWSLTKRHSSEDLFGVQVCGKNPFVMTRCAQLLQEQTTIDFLDVNLSCPIDKVFRQGAGSGLLCNELLLESVITSMIEVMEIPLSVHLRSGLYTSQNNVHTLVPRLSDWGVSVMTIHGLTREQRFTLRSNWAYIEKCAKLAGPTPLLGNGDVLSFENYERARTIAPSVAGVMIGRGALIKPWIFTEIKERRHWDISSAERLDILKKYVNYGLEHWGSDTRGVEKTRYFLLEWLSFLHRYIPVGVLECVPQRMNERPPYYEGRDDLETLMASSNTADWIKISEMLLGPVPNDFYFSPKYRASSWK